MRKIFALTLIFTALFLTEASGQQPATAAYAFNPVKAENIHLLSAYPDNRRMAAPQTFDFLETSTANYPVRYTSRGGILLKNIMWSGTSGLVLGTGWGIKLAGEDAQLKNVLPFTVLGTGIGIAAGLVIGTIKAIKRKDDIQTSR